MQICKQAIAPVRVGQHVLQLLRRKDAAEAKVGPAHAHAAGDTHSIVTVRPPLHLCSRVV